MNYREYTPYQIFKYVFIWHMVLVGLMAVFVVMCKANPEPFEAPFLWAVFLLVDFPSSIIVFTTGGAGVVGVPEFFIGNWGISDVIWPSAVFQIVGVINWFLIFAGLSLSRSFVNRFQR